MKVKNILEFTKVQKIQQFPGIPLWGIYPKGKKKNQALGLNIYVSDVKHSMIYELNT